MHKYLKFEIQKNGDLKIKLTDDGRHELKDMIENEKGYDEMWDTLMEHEQCNGGYYLISPESVGALTDSPMIAHQSQMEFPDSGGYTINEDADVWWFPDYQLVNELHELRKNRSIVFTKSQ